MDAFLTARSTDANASITAKVSDFGLSSLLFIQSFKERSQDRAVANPTWLAPEVLNEEEYSEKSDVYAAGVMFHELLTGRHPYEEFTFKFMWELEARLFRYPCIIPALALTLACLGHHYIGEAAVYSK